MTVFVIYAVLIIVATFVLALAWMSSTGRIDTEEVGIAVMITLLFSLFTVVIPAYSIIRVCGGFHEGYSTGTREGYLVKVSEKGLVWKTYEAEIMLGTSEVAAVSQVYGCSTIDKKIYKQLQDALGKNIRVSYNQWALAPAWLGETSYIIDTLEVLGEEKGEEDGSN